MEKKIGTRHFLDLKTRGNSDFVLPQVKIVNRGRDIRRYIRYRGPLTWELVPDDIKESESLSIFKDKIKSWKPSGCSCRLCKSYIPGIGYGIMKDGVLV